jgi:VWFA-related protein
LSSPDDEIFVIGFNEHVRHAWTPRIISDSAIEDLQATLMRQIFARGRTALYDAIDAGLDALTRAAHTRQVLIVVSDGADNASQLSEEAMLARLGTSSVMVYTVALQDPVDRDGNAKLLRRVSALTGGETFSPRRPRDVPGVLEHIASDIRATYTLGYVPTNQIRDGQLRRLRVVARHPDGSTLKVQARGGYRAPRSGSAVAGGGGADRAR